MVRVDRGNDRNSRVRKSETHGQMIKSNQDNGKKMIAQLRQRLELKRSNAEGPQETSEGPTQKCEAGVIFAQEERGQDVQQTVVGQGWMMLRKSLVRMP